MLSSDELHRGRIVLLGSEDHHMRAFGTPDFQPTLQGPQ
jgi:hypothetical protein